MLNRRYWATMMKNRTVDRSTANSFIPSAMHQSMANNSQFNQSHGHSERSNGQHGMRPSLNLFNGGLQKTFATG